MQDVSKIWGIGAPLRELVQGIVAHHLASLGLIDQRLLDLRRKQSFENAERQIVRRLHTGEWIAAGRIETVAGYGLEIIPAEFWAKARVFYRHNKARYLEQEFSDIHVVEASGQSPLDSLNQPVVRSKNEQNGLPHSRRRAASPSEPYPKRAGAIPFEEERQAAILESYKREPRLLKWKEEERREYIVRVAEELHPGLDVRRGFGRTMVYETIKKLKEAGRLSSDSVR